MEKNNSKGNNQKIKSYSKVSWLVLLFTLTISLISLISVIFPALISETVTISGFDRMGLTVFQIDPYETGPLAGLLIVTNAVVFGLYIFRKKIPKISKIFSIEVPHKISLLVILVVIVAYGSITFSEVYTEDTYEDWNKVKARIGNLDTSMLNPFDPHVRFFLIEHSMTVFGNYKIIPLLFSMALLAMTYLFTTSITKNRFSGLVSMGLVLQSHIFLTYDTSPTYTSFWVFFYLVSLYAVVKLWFTTPVFLVASIFSKSLTALFSPMSIFFILNSHIPKKQKIILSAVIFAIIIAGGSMMLSSGDIQEEPRWDEFWTGFTSFAFQMRFDVITILFLIPVIFGLFVISKNNRYANSISILIGGMLFAAPLLTGLTDQTNQPYRVLPIIIFFAVGAGMLFSNIRKI